MSTRSVAVVALAALLAPVACSGGGGTDAAATTTAADATTTTTAPPAPEYEPVFDEAVCVDEVDPSPRVDCGWLTVPEDRANPDAASVRLPVAIIRSIDPEPALDPIVYFSGGPGFPGIDIAEAFISRDLGGPRDIILFDQRGTGRAEPSLDCPAFTDIAWATLGAATPREIEAQRSLDTYDDCRRQLEADGVDLDSYDTSATAADVADLRIALGIDEWNIFGISYGTAVALTVLREHPEGVRSAVIDSVYPTTVGNSGTKLAASALRVLDVFFGGCAKDPGCSAAYPTLREDVAALAAEWNETPFEADITDPDGQPRQLAITGDDTIAGLWNALYDTSLIGLLPSLIAPLRERGPAAEAIVEQLAVQGVDQLAGAAEAQTIAVDCADRQRIDTLSGVPDVLAEHPELASLLFLAPTRDACERYGVESAPASFNEPVTSDIPTLVFADEYDPITPPEDSRAAADALGNATFFLFPGLGHGATLSHDCPESIFRAFVADPTAAPDGSCIAAMSPPEWVLPGP